MANQRPSVINACRRESALAIDGSVAVRRFRTGAHLRRVACRLNGASVQPVDLWP